MVRFDVVVDSDVVLVGMFTVETSGVLLKRSLPGNRHRQYQGVERRVVEAFSHQPPGRKQYMRCGVAKLRERLEYRGTLLFRQAPVQDETVVDLICQEFGQTLKMVRSFGQQQNLATFIDGTGDVLCDTPVALGILGENTEL